MKRLRKRLQKMWEARIYMHNAKNQKYQSTKHTNNRVHTCAHNLKNTKIQQYKKMHHWFGNYKPKNQTNNAGKSADTKNKYRQNECEWTIMRFASKSAWIPKNPLANLARDGRQQKNTENSKNFKNKKLANRFFKTKHSTNQIHAVLPLNYVYFWELSVHTVIFKIFASVKYWKF